MLTKIKEFVKNHQNDIILLIGVVLISLLSFAMGYIVGKSQEKEPIRIEFRLQPTQGRGVSLRESALRPDHPSAFAGPIQNLESRIVGDEGFALIFTFASMNRCSV